MAEAVGLALGAVALLGPALDGYRTCSSLFRDMRSWSKDFKLVEMQFQTQKTIFEAEYRFLLELNSEAMLDDPEHGQDQGSERHQETFGSTFDNSLAVITNSLERIEKKLNKVKAAKVREPKSILSISNQTPSSRTPLEVRNKYNKR
jgi:hypothetical protein